MINIGTNFLYKGILFLDDRQGIARSKNDLKEWDDTNVPIPVGFEVYLNTENDPAWYTYKPAQSGGIYNEETGWFERRLDKAYVDSQIEVINNQINTIWHGSKDGLGGIEEIWAAINNIHFDIPTTYNLDASNTGGDYLPGHLIEPRINWSVKKTVWGQSGTTTVPHNEVDSVTISIDNAAAEEVPHASPWTLGHQITEDHTATHTYKLTVTYNGESWNNTATYKWKPYDWAKYFGVSSVSPLTDINQLTPNSPISQGWGSGSIGYEGTVNCSQAGGFPNGGYPCYVFPSNLYSPNLKVIVGGFNMSDFRVTDITIGTKDYKAVTFSIIQHEERLTIKYTTS